MLLLSRDLIRVHKVRKQINGPHDSPYAQRLDLGWVIVGSVCLGKVHKPDIVNTFYTNTLENGRASLLKPCPNRCFVKETHDSTGSLICKNSKDHIGCTVFQRSKDDDKMAPSFEDVAFLNIMEPGFYKDKDNSWTAPLPFKTQRRRLPNNKAQALNRFRSLQRSFNKNPERKEHLRNLDRSEQPSTQVLSTMVSLLTMSS